MSNQRAADETRAIEINAVLEHLQLLNDRIITLILSSQKARELKKPKSKRARKRR